MEKGLYNSITIVRSTEFYNKQVFGNGGEIGKKLEERNMENFPAKEIRTKNTNPCLECKNYSPNCESRVLDRENKEFYCDKNGIIIDKNIFEIKPDFSNMTRVEKEEIDLYFREIENPT